MPCDNFKQTNIFLPWNWNFWCFFKAASARQRLSSCPYKALSFQIFKICSISKQFSATKIQIFSFREEIRKMFVCLYFLKRNRTFNRKYPITVSQLHFGQRLTFLSPFCMPFLDLTCFETLWLFSYFTLVFFWGKDEGFIPIYTWFKMIWNYQNLSMLYT